MWMHRSLILSILLHELIFYLATNIFRRTLFAQVDGVRFMLLREWFVMLEWKRCIATKSSMSTDCTNFEFKLLLHISFCLESFSCKVSVTVESWTKVFMMISSPNHAAGVSGRRIKVALAWAKIEEFSKVKYPERALCWVLDLSAEDRSSASNSAGNPGQDDWQGSFHETFHEVRIALKAISWSIWLGHCVFSSSVCINCILGFWTLKSLEDPCKYRVFCAFHVFTQLWSDNPKALPYPV